MVPNYFDDSSDALGFDKYTTCYHCDQGPLLVGESYYIQPWIRNNKTILVCEECKDVSFFIDKEEDISQSMLYCSEREAYEWEMCKI